MVAISQGWDFAKKREKGEVPGSLVIWTPGFHYCGLGSTPGQGTENPKSQAVLPKERKKERDREQRRNSNLQESGYVLDCCYKLGIKESKHKKESVDSEKLIQSMVLKSP